MHVILAGASGLIGSALAEALGARGNRVTRLVRRAPRTADEVQWAPGRVSLDPRVLEGVDAVVALKFLGKGAFGVPKTVHLKQCSPCLSESCVTQ